MSVFLPNEPQVVIELCFPYLQPLSGWQHSTKYKQYIRETKRRIILNKSIVFSMNHGEHCRYYELCMYTLEKRTLKKIQLSPRAPNLKKLINYFKKNTKQWRKIKTNISFRRCKNDPIVLDRVPVFPFQWLTINHSLSYKEWAQIDLVFFLTKEIAAVTILNVHENV